MTNISRDVLHFFIHKKEDVVLQNVFLQDTRWFGSPSMCFKPRDPYSMSVFPCKNIFMDYWFCKDLPSDLPIDLFYKEGAQSFPFEQWHFSLWIHQSRDETKVHPNRHGVLTEALFLIDHSWDANHSKTLEMQGLSMIYLWPTVRPARQKRECNEQESNTKVGKIHELQE
jgi:hypothetical protein